MRLSRIREDYDLENRMLDRRGFRTVIPFEVSPHGAERIQMLPRTVQKRKARMGTIPVSFVSLIFVLPYRLRWHVNAPSL